MMISVIIPNYNGLSTLKRCLDAVLSSNYPTYECIVVDDGSTDNSFEIARDLATQVVKVEGGPKGPGHARNLGARAASGEIVFFVDADVIICPDTLRKVAASFAGSSALAAIFGSYDDQPGDGYFLSQYKNLFHHFVHQQANEYSGSFWSGCGAIRREIFLDIGGFDTLKYPNPSIEDIELGRRLIQKGHKILVNKSIQVKHLKRWTLLNLVKTDVFDRGVPWTQLVVEDRKIPNDLNLGSTQRWSAFFAVLLLMFMTASALFHQQMLLLPVQMCLFWFMLQCWKWTRTVDQFEVGWRSFLMLSFLFLLFAGLAYRLGYMNFLPPVFLLLGIVISGPRLTRRSQMWSQAIFALMMIALVVLLLQIILEYPLWLIVLVFAILGIFIVLNYRFYVFFSDKRGAMFALAVVPFHMLYFLYSMAAFVLGVFLYYWKIGLPFYARQTEGKS